MPYGHSGEGPYDTDDTAKMVCEKVGSKMFYRQQDGKYVTCPPGSLAAFAAGYTLFTSG